MPIKFPTTLKLTTTITRELNLELSANDIFVSDISFIFLYFYSALNRLSIEINHNHFLS